MEPDDINTEKESWTPDDITIVICQPDKVIHIENLDTTEPEPPETNEP